MIALEPSEAKKALDEQLENIHQPMGLATFGPYGQEDFIKHIIHSYINAYDNKSVNYEILMKKAKIGDNCMQ